MSISGAWNGNSLVFSARRGAVVGLWELKVDPEKLAVSMPAKPLKTGDPRDYVISSSLAGDTLAICQWNTPAMHVWRIDQASNSSVSRNLVQVTNDPDFDLAPSISHNGKWLVFLRKNSDEKQVIVRDKQNGNESAIDFPHLAQGAPLIDDDRKAIVYESREALSGIHSIWVGTPDGVDIRKLCTGCTNPTGWFGKDDAVLFSNADRSEARMVSTSGGPVRTILSGNGQSIQDAVWSPENQFLTFAVSSRGSMDQIFATRFRPSDRNPDPNWIPITGEDSSSRKPRWSGDGKIIFYLSKRDGFWCVWAQSFDPLNGHVTGAPFAVQHYHNFAESPSGIAGTDFNISVGAGDSLYLNVLKTPGTIWAGQLVNESVLSVLR